jgi:hypothetical protein
MMRPTTHHGQAGWVAPLPELIGQFVLQPGFSLQVRVRALCLRTDGLEVEREAFGCPFRRN